MKKYLDPQADLILLGREDLLTASLGDDHGMEVPAVTDADDWQVGEENNT